MTQCVQFVDSKIRQKIVLLCIEKAAINDKNIISKIAYVLNTLYDADILEEGTHNHTTKHFFCSINDSRPHNCFHTSDIILKWFDHPNKKLDLNISTQLRDNAKPFVEWLQNAEEESD
jgi:hypothetical protein